MNRRNIATFAFVSTYINISISQKNNQSYDHRRRQQQQNQHQYHHHHHHHLTSYCDNSNRYLNRNFVADAADIVSPAVVNILCAIDSPISPGAASSGSGFIISKDGFIVTNAHVVEGASSKERASSKVLITMWNSKKRYGIVHSMDRQ